MKSIHILIAALAWAVTAQVQAQTQLGIRLTPEITLSGSPAIYAIQWAQILGGATNWVTLTNATVSNAPVVLHDSTAPSPSQRFYRCLFLSLLATNGLENPDPAKWAWIPPGAFVMGSPTNEALRNADESQHAVTLTRGFYMSKYDVTQAEFLSLMSYNPSWFVGDANRPVEHLLWDEATNYCGQLTARERGTGGIGANWVYRLPTEAEWEYACRAGTTTAFHYGNALHAGMANFFWYYEYDAAIGHIYIPNPAYPPPLCTTAVGSYQPNAWGLYDMHGNVWDWCQDWYGSYPTGSVSDPQGPMSGSFRVVRGGCWYHYGGACRAANRCIIFPDAQDYGIGFRVVLGPVP